MSSPRVLALSCALLVACSQSRHDAPHTGRDGGSQTRDAGAHDAGRTASDAAVDAGHRPSIDAGGDAQTPDAATPELPGVGTGPALSATLFAQNYWREQDITQLWSVVQESGVKLVRYGGHYADVEDVPSREKYADVVQQIRAIGAEPYLQISHTFSADTARDVVDYLNNVHKLSVRFWCVGNEPDLAQNGPISAADTAAYVKTLASAMKQADPSILIFAPELAWYDRDYLTPMLGGELDITGKDANGHYYIDGVSFHRYPFGSSYQRADVLAQAGAMRADVKELLIALEAANQKHQRAGARKLGWALTEFNISYANPAANGVDDVGVHSFLNGQFFAEVFGIGMELGAFTMATWSVHESDGARGAGDLGYLDGPLGSTKPRSSYYHLQLLAQHSGGQFAPATSSDALVRVIASGDGKHVSVLILNEDQAAAREYRLQLDGTPSSGKPVTLTVSAGLDASYDGQIAAQSSELLVFDAKGQLSEHVRYGIEQARAEQGPSASAP
jgi:hypothetical protein